MSIFIYTFGSETFKLYHPKEIRWCGWPGGGSAGFQKTHFTDVHKNVASEICIFIPFIKSWLLPMFLFLFIHFFCLLRIYLYRRIRIIRLNAVFFFVFTISPVFVFLAATQNQKCKDIFGNYSKFSTLNRIHISLVSKWSKNQDYSFSMIRVPLEYF